MEILSRQNLIAARPTSQLVTFMIPIDLKSIVSTDTANASQSKPHIKRRIIIKKPDLLWYLLRLQLKGMLSKIKRLPSQQMNFCLKMTKKNSMMSMWRHFKKDSASPFSITTVVLSVESPSKFYFSRGKKSQIVTLARMSRIKTILIGSYITRLNLKFKGSCFMLRAKRSSRSQLKIKSIFTLWTKQH